MKKKLIFVTEALWIGGIETALCNLLNRLDYDTYDVTCLVLRDCLELADRLPPQCRLLVADREHTVSFPRVYRYSRLHHLTEPTENPSRLHRAFLWAAPGVKWLENRLYIRYIRDQMKREHFDTCIIYSDRTAECAVRAILAKRFLMFYHHGAMRREYHDEYGYHKSEKIVAVSPGQAEKLKAYRPQYTHKIIAIHNLTDVSGVREKSLALPAVTFPEDTFHIVSCGRLSPAKGMDLAVEACKLLAQRGLRDIHWWIVGGGPEEAALRRQIETLGMTQQVTLLGMQENPYPYIRRADLYVQPSRFEGHCVTVLEARILAKPIVATNTAAQEQLTNGVTGRLCAPDAESIAAAVQELYASPETRKRYQRALEQYDFEEANARIMQELYALL